MIRKNNAKFEMLFLLGFLATLIIAFGTFFLGLNIGIDKTEAKYAYLNAAPPGEENEASYQQQDLVTFYYVVFQPYQQFKEDYLTLVDDMSRSNSKSVSADAMKEIREKAKASYEQIAAQSIADSSPLLKEAQTDYLKSLKLFEDSMGQVKTTAGSKKRRGVGQGSQPGRIHGQRKKLRSAGAKEILFFDTQVDRQNER